MKNHLGLAIPPVGNGISTPSALGIMQAYGAHLYLPGVSVNEGNYVDSFGAAPLASVNDYIGYVADSLIGQQPENLIPNSEFNGAVHPSTLPTGWAGGATSNGVTLAMVGYGTDSNGSYLEFSVVGTASSITYLDVRTAFGAIAVIPGELFTHSCYGHIGAGTVSGASVVSYLTIYNGGSYLADLGTKAFLSYPSTIARTIAISNASANTALYKVLVVVPSGNTVNFVFRFYKPSIVRGNASFYVPTIGTSAITNDIPAYQQTTGFKPQLLDSAGIKSWKGDGTDDRLNLAKPSLDFNGNCFRVMALKLPPGASPGSYVYAGAYGPTSCRGLQVYIPEGGTALKLSMKDSSATGVDAGTIRAANEKVVISGYRTPTSVDIRCRGNIVGPYALSSSTAQANWAATNERILCYSPNGADGLYCPYEVYGMITGNGSITLAELDILETYIASIAGIIFVP